MTFMKRLGLKDMNQGACTGLNWNSTQDQGTLDIVSPADGKKVASVYLASPADYDNIIDQAEKAFIQWRKVPAPQRGEVVRQIANALREYKTDLGTLVSCEMGKSLQEGFGEVQEMIDICDFCRGTVPAALWVYHAFGTAGASPLRSVSSPGYCGNYYGL